MPIGVGAHQLAGDLGAKHRCGYDAKVIFDRCQIESRKMIELQAIGIA